METPNKYPRAFSHIGLSVPEIHRAVKFYTEVIGWYVIMPPSTVTEESETAIGQMCIDVFGSGWGTFEIAHLSASDGIGIELFSFPNGRKEAPAFEPFSTGLFHFCVQDPDVEGLVNEIVANGGKQRMLVREYYPNDKPYRMCYVEDPFGIGVATFTGT